MADDLGAVVQRLTAANDNRLRSPVSSRRNRSASSVDFDALSESLRNLPVYAAAPTAAEQRGDGFGFGDIFDGLADGLKFTLKALDTPRSAVVSTAKETLDALQGEGFDFDDWFDQTRTGYGFGNLLDDEFAVDGTAKSVLGFIGDVAFDPLTYVAPQVKLVKLGRTGLADRAFRLGYDDLGAKIFREGMSSASADDLVRLSGKGVTKAGKVGDLADVGELKKGLHVGVPFSSRQTRISSNGGTRIFDAAARTARLTGRKTNIYGLMGGRFGNQKLKMLDPKTSAAEVKDIFLSVRVGQQANQAARVFDADLDRKTVAFLNELGGPDSDVDRLVQRAWGGNTDAIDELERLQPGLWARAQEFRQTAMLDDFNKFTGGDLIGRENWQGLVRSDEFLDFISVNSVNFPKGSRLAQGFEQKADLIPGNSFLGIELLEPGTVVRSVDGAPRKVGAISEQVREITEANIALLGKDNFVQMFDESATRSILARLPAVKIAARRRRIENQLTDLGVVVKRHVDVDKMGYEDVVASAAGKLAVENLQQANLRKRYLAENLNPVRQAVAALYADVPQSGISDAVSRAEASGRALRAARGQLENLRVERVAALSDGNPDELKRLQAGIDELVDRVAKAEADLGITAAPTDALSEVTVRAAQDAAAPPGTKAGWRHDADIADSMARSADEAGKEMAKLGHDLEGHRIEIEHILEQAERNAESLQLLDDQVERVMRSAADRAFNVGLDDTVEAATKEAAAFHGLAEKFAADMRAANIPELSVDEIMSKLKNRDILNSVDLLLQRNYKALSNTAIAPEDVVETLNAATRLWDNPQGLVRYIDKANSFFKTYAIMTPGFHSRNFLGGTFNNYLARVPAKRYVEYGQMQREYHRALRKGAKSHEEALDAVARKFRSKPDRVAAFRAVADSGALNSGRTAVDVDSFHDELELVGMSGLRKFRKRNNLIDNPLSRGSFRVGNSVEDTLRGTLMYDRMITGSSVEDALGDVFKYHFDYNDLSDFEHDFIRRVIPFYTWTRKNLPLQLEGLLTNPKAYNRFGHLKRNIEFLSEEEEVVPGYVQDSLNIRLPFAAKDIPFFGGDSEARLYLVPDLPFKGLTRAIDPNDIAGMASPYVKTPIERKFGRRFFNEIPFKASLQPVPESWNALGIGAALEAAGWGHKINGQYYASDKALYTLEQFFPPFAKARRLLPSDTEERFKSRQASTWVNTALGLGVYSNTDIAVETELWIRAEREKEAAYRAKNIEQIAAGEQR